MLGDIREAVRSLEEALPPDDNQEGRLIDAVVPLSERRQLARLLHSLLADRQMTTACAAESYAHPLGFDRLVLTPSSDQAFQLRLHVWWPGRHRIVEDVHNHRFPFASAILDGGLRMQLLERSAQGTTMQEFDSASAGPVGSTQFTHLGVVRVAPTFAGWMPKGTFYCMAAAALHRITGTDPELTATLFLRGGIVQPTAAVISEEAAQHRSTIVRRTMDPSSFSDRIAAYAETLEERSTG
jgi:hypothetical protein